MGKRGCRIRRGPAAAGAAFPAWATRRRQPHPRIEEVTGMMDQHAYLKIAPGDDIKVGDMIAFDIPHPCLHVRQAAPDFCR
ncbi:hypothetical protein ACU4HD_43480 [Cupriavidus basilensis]